MQGWQMLKASCAVHIPPCSHAGRPTGCFGTCTLLSMGGHGVALSAVQVDLLMPTNISYTMLARSACGSPVAGGTYSCSLPARPSSAARGATASSLQYIATPLYAMRCDVLRLKHESLHAALGCCDNSGTAGQVTMKLTCPIVLLRLCSAPLSLMYHSMFTTQGKLPAPASWLCLILKFWFLGCTQCLQQ